MVQLEHRVLAASNVELLGYFTIMSAAAGLCYEQEDAEIVISHTNVVAVESPNNLLCRTET